MRRAASRGALAAAILAFGAGPAAAQASDVWTASITLASDYRSKGASKTGGRPQAALDVERAVGGAGYLGASGSNIRNSAGSDAQINLSAGWRPEALGLRWELDSTHEFYPGSETDENDVVWQVSARATREAGPLSAALVIQHQPDGFAGTGANTYLAASGAWRLREGLEAVAGLGRREQDRSVDYTAWNAGLALDLTRGATLDVRWYATNRDELGPNYEDRLVAALNLDF